MTESLCLSHAWCLACLLLASLQLSESCCIVWKEPKPELDFCNFCIFAVNLVINLSDNWTGLRQTRILCVCVLGGWWIKISEFFRLIHSLANSESAFCIFTWFFASIDLKNISFYFSYMSALRITEHAKKRTQDLSGGTKRKVTVFYKIMYVRPILFRCILN